MSEDTDSETELYGTSPWVIGELMIIISLITPLGFIPGSYDITTSGISLYSNFMVYSLIWVYSMDIFSGYFIAIHPAVLYLTLPLSIFNILYIRQIVRYYKGKSSRYSAVMAGVLSLIVPTFFSLVISFVSAPLQNITFIVPIPIQFIAGLIFLHKIPGPELISPWPGIFKDYSWWIPKRPEWWDRYFSSKSEDEESLSLADATRWTEVEEQDP
ncbi:MAG: hypothetical protein JW779_12985 [Candidatus Thorarchaeota archaeon]|nr:hypothetical protein [Candidatus Thorarchaeota archaeon]